MPYIMLLSPYLQILPNQRVYKSIQLLKMEVEDLLTHIHAQLNNNHSDSPIHRKAAAILESLMHASNAIPNFKNIYAGNNKTIALYLSAGVFKLLKRALAGQQKFHHNLDAYLLLLSMTVPESSTDALIQGGIIKELRIAMQTVLSKKDNTPLMVRLAIAVLSSCLAPQMARTNYQTGEERRLLLDLFEKAVASPRSNALSKECSRLLVHLLKNNRSVAAVIAQQAKMSLFSSLQEKQQLYFSNVKQVMIQLPIVFLNDICHKVCSNLAEKDASDPNHEHYLSQTYFFLQKMVPKLGASTLEDILLVLVNAVPANTQPEKVQLSYVQLLKDLVKGLSQADQRAANKLLSPAVSVMIEMLLSAPKIQKFAENQLTFILSSCITPSLWHNTADEWNLDKISLEEDHALSKLICLFKGLLSSRFANNNMIANVVSSFVRSLDENTLEQCSELIHKVVEYRQELHQKNFRKIMEAVLSTYGLENIIKLYPMGLEGDVGSADFQDHNNLWILASLQKTQKEEKMSVFCRQLLPLIQRAKHFQVAESLSTQRREAFQLIQNLMWRCAKVFSKSVDPTTNYQEILALIENQLRRSTQSTVLQLSRALQLLAGCLAALNKTSKSAELLIKTLANLFQVNQNNSSQVQKAIKALSKIAPRDYVKRVFDKNIEKLIALTEEMGLAKEESKNLKNLQILMAMNAAIDLSESTVTTKYRLSREQLLLKLIDGLLKSAGTFQKKGYKYLGDILVTAPRSFYLEILQLLDSQLKVQNGSKFHRLVVIGKLWCWIKNLDHQMELEKIIEFIKMFLPQILLSLKQQNKGARSQAVAILQGFTQKMQELDVLSNFIESVCAGLISDRSEMKLATLNGLSIIVAKGFCDADIFRDILQISMILLTQKRQELYKAIVQFCKKGLLGQPLEKQKQYLPKVLRNLFEADQEGKMEHRSVLRHFLIRLTKRHGRDSLEAMMPSEHVKMLSHALKMQNREKRKRKENNIARAEQIRAEKQKQRQNESQSQSDQKNQAKQQQAMDAEQPLKDGEQPLRELSNANNLLLKYDLQEEQFHFQQQTINRPKLKQNDQQRQDEITFDQRGLMIIHERKRPKIQTEQMQEDNQPADKPNNTSFKKKPKVEIHQVKESGSSFRSSRAGGDLQLKDKPEPYAFIQFSSKALNKRFKKRAESALDYLFEKKEGGLKGLKARMAKR